MRLWKEGRRDAMNNDPDYSAAYVVLQTDHSIGLQGHGLTFTIAREIAPTRVATGEHVQNRIIFKQLFQANAIGIC